MPLTSLLAATDFSIGGDHALQRACQLTDEHQAALSVLHVVSLPEDKLAWLPQELTLPQQTRERLQQQLQKRIAERCPQIAGGQREIKLAVRQGRPSQLIIDAADRAELIILGAAGINRWQDGLVGSTAERVVRHAPQPVLVVRQTTDGPYQRVLIATDFSPHSARALAATARLAPTAELHLLHVRHLWHSPQGSVPASDADHTPANPPPEDAWKRLEHAVQAPLQALLEKAGVAAERIRLHLRQGHPPAEITALARALNVDLVAGGTRGYSNASDILLGSTSAGLLHGTCSDMLLCP